AARRARPRSARPSARPSRRPRRGRRAGRARAARGGAAGGSRRTRRRRYAARGPRTYHRRSPSAPDGGCELLVLRRDGDPELPERAGGAAEQRERRPAAALLEQQPGGAEVVGLVEGLELERPLEQTDGLVDVAASRCRLGRDVREAQEQALEPLARRRGPALVAVVREQRPAVARKRPREVCPLARVEDAPRVGLEQVGV